MIVATSPTEPLTHVRHRRLVPQGRTPGRARDHRRAVRPDHPSRAGRQRSPRGPRFRLRHAPAVHHRCRRRPSADHHTGRPLFDRLQRRDLQPPRPARRARPRRVRLPHEERHRDAPRLLRPLAGRRLAPPRGHVRRRDLEPRGAHADAGAGPRRHQAAVPHTAERRHRVRLRDPGAQSPARPSLRHRRARGPRLLQLRPRAEAAFDLPASGESRTGARPASRPHGRAGTPRLLATALPDPRRGVGGRLDRGDTRRASCRPSSSTCWRTYPSARFSRGVWTPAR